MASEAFDCREVKLGLSESQEFTMSEDAEVNVAYDSNKCYSAWIEYKVDGDEAVKRMNILPMAQRREGPSKIMLPSGATFKIIASVGIYGHFKGHVFY